MGAGVQRFIGFSEGVGEGEWEPRRGELGLWGVGISISIDDIMIKMGEGGWRGGLMFINGY